MVLLVVLGRFGWFRVLVTTSRIDDRGSSLEIRASRDCQLTFARYCNWTSHTFCLNSPEYVLGSSMRAFLQFK